MTRMRNTYLQNHVQEIADSISSGVVEGEGMDGEEATAMEWLGGCLDIEYVVNGRKEYLGARVLVASSGPNIWVDTRRKTVEGFWEGQYAKASFEDNIGLNEALECRFTMRQAS